MPQTTARVSGFQLSQRLTVDLGQLLIRFSDFSPCVCRRRWTPTEEMLQHSELFKGKLLKISLFFDNSIYPGYMQPSTFFYPLLTSSTFSNQVFIPFLLAGRKREEDLPSTWISSLLLHQISFLQYQNTSYAFVLLAAIKSSAGNILPQHLDSDLIQKEGPAL